MKIYFCTLFDVNYLERGIILYESLEKVCKDFLLYTVAMDQATYDILEKKAFKNIKTINIDDIRYPELLKARADRSHRAFCWTCSSWIIKYIFDTFHPDICTYLDSDEFFYSDPSNLIKGFARSVASAAIIGHHYGVGKYAEIMCERSGKYCVQFNSFKNDETGLMILNDWCMDVATECTDHVIEGKFGDQKYLEDWHEKYKNVYEYKELGAGVAPWNLYRFKSIGDVSKVKNCSLYDTISDRETEVIFFHYHSLIIGEDYADINVFTRYGRHDKELVYSFYKDYLSRVIKIRKELQEQFSGLITKETDSKENQTTGESKTVINKIKDQGVWSYIYGAIKYKLCKRYDYIKIM